MEPPVWAVSHISRPRRRETQYGRAQEQDDRPTLSRDSSDGLYDRLAYRVAMATKIHCTIVGVKRVSTKTGYDKYEITYRTFGRDEDETIPSPLIGDFRYGKVTEWLWAKKNDDGTDYWPGRRAVLYKHNDPPKEGDMSSAGYRCCVFAEALDK